MELLDFSDEVLDMIFWELEPWNRKVWYKLLFVCKRFHVILQDYRQDAVIDYINWEEPYASHHCQNCEGDLSPNAIAYCDDSCPYSSDHQGWRIYCSVECATPNLPSGSCIHCNEQAIRPYMASDIYDMEKPSSPFECLKCNRYALDRIIIGKRFKPTTEEGKKEMVEQLRQECHYADRCVICDEENLGGSAILKIQMSKKMIKWCTVCSFTCFMECLDKVNVIKYKRPTEWVEYPEFK